MVMNDFNTVIKKVIMLHSFVVTKMYSIKLQKQAERQTELKRMGNVLWLKLRYYSILLEGSRKSMENIIVGGLRANTWTPTYQTWSRSVGYTP